MLIIFLRIVFVLLSVVIGLTSGRYFYQGLDDAPGWLGGAMGFGVAITLIAIEVAFRRRFTRSLVAFLVGLGGGLALSALLLLVVELVIQDRELRHNLDIPLALVTTYLVLITVLRNADRFRVVVPFVEFRDEGVREGVRVLDAASLRDGRLIGILDAGLLDQRLIIPRRILVHIESEAGSDDPAARARGQRALENLRLLRERSGERLVIDDTEIPTASTFGDLVIELARLENGRLVTSDSDLAERARAERIPVLDLQVLAGALAPTIRPGETIQVAIERPGDGEHQGVGFLDDGSMVVVSNARAQVGETVACTVLRLHRTSTGRMIFADRRAASEAQRPV